MSIKDCFGVTAVIGDRIVFSVGNSGAKTWERAIVTKITKKSIYFKGQPGSNWRLGELTELRRSEGCFVIDVKFRGNGMWPEVGNGQSN